ncbi:MAG: phenylalanine--tRNA ligase subunit alpha [Candidatus Methanomethylicia archaeon]|nr:phenylalanine--tRNA ligase subunit alpha [Candidatus Methanomethylicia archaeon]MDW7988988.1 phenylalanine--tRNA ligase subunit alpha [Nitrososphaerota archaeon]
MSIGACGDEKPISHNELRELIKHLHPIEIRVLISLTKGFNNLKQISIVTGLPLDSIMWAFEGLKEKGLISLNEVVDISYELDVEGENYLKNYFPEQRIIKKLEIAGGEAFIENLNLTEDEIRIGLSWAVKLGYISIIKKSGRSIIKLNIKDVDVQKDYKPYVLLNKIKHRLQLSEDELKLLEDLRKRGQIIKIIKHKDVYASLTLKGSELGEIVNQLFAEQRILEWGGLKIVNELTRELIISGEWENVYFRPYDVSKPVKKILVGKKHPYKELIDEIREILIGLGFEEVISPPIEVNFWNADALFMPSDHPAREIHGIFYVDYKPMSIDEIVSEDIWFKVKETHENGWKTFSKGWGYWDPNLALKRILRSQTTALSARCLAQLKDEDLPKKIFTIDRNYRPDRIDATHLMEFNQCEGIVVSNDVNFRHLLGFLKIIAEAFGIKDVKFQPAYFPFTEPSVVGYIKHEKLGWIEALPAGIFRPEVTYPLGIKVPVLAWGLGIDRLAMVALKIEDIRLLFSNDLNWLRSQRIPSLWGV